MMRKFKTFLVGVLLVTVLIQTSKAEEFDYVYKSNTNLEKLLEKMPLSDAELISESSYNKYQIACIAYNIYFEARGSTLLDKIGVGYVILNRLGNPEFGINFCEIVFQHKPHVTQFAWTHYPQRAKIIEWDQW